MNLEIHQGEIWYSYTYDLGLEINNTENIFQEALKEDYCLVGFSAPDEHVYYKENGKVIVADFSSSTYRVENKFVVSSAPKDPFVTKMIHFASMYRLAEIHAFSKKYREDAEYALLVLSPIYLEAKINNQNKSMVLFPYIKITKAGVLILTFRYSFEKVDLHELICIDNLFRSEIITIGIPSSVAKTHFHLAALYHGLAPSSREYKDHIGAIKAKEFADNVKLYIGTAENITFEQVAENYLYSVIECWFLKKQLMPKDFHKLARAHYWQSRPTLFLQKFSDQMDTATQTLETMNATIHKILNRVNSHSEKEAVDKFIDLRQFEDYFLVMTRGLTVKGYSKQFIENSIDKCPETERKREWLWSNLETQVMIDYIHQLFMELKILEGLLLNDPPSTQKKLIKHTEALYRKKYIYEANMVYSGELKKLIDYAKQTMGYFTIEENIQKNFELRKLKLEVIRNNRIFWFGSFLTLLFGISNVSNLMKTFYAPLFCIIGWNYFFAHQIAWSTAITTALILIGSAIIYRTTRF
jgi:hypothetical protein